MKTSVLLIEDNEANRHLATFLLEKLGCEVHHAGDGARGLTLAESCKPALIVLDIQMPEMDGYEVAARLRAKPTTTAIPILVVTSYAQAGDKQRALALGVADYLEKPFEPDDFINRVLRLLPARQPTP
ncbi:MAG: response regulator [Verrucomicrobia bacterium]|nr:response regulator [Verrucomicrobiota bacterium]